MSDPGENTLTRTQAAFDYIDSDEQLLSWIQQRRSELAPDVPFRTCLDTEADSLHHYREQICLLQVACAEKYALIDPFPISNMHVLFEFLDQSELWFHGADYDLSLLRRTYQWEPRVMRDTQIAARLLGFRHFGLAALVKEMHGVELSKAAQKADWSQRPLPTPMLHYAVDDVRYLLPMAEQFVLALREKGREAWFVECCESLQRDVAERGNAPKEEPWRIQGIGRLQPKALAFVRALWLWRDQIAEAKNIPSYRILSNKQIVALAEDFEQGRDIFPPKGWRPQWKADFVQVLRLIEDMPVSEYPSRIRVPRSRFAEEQRNLIQTLCAKRDQCAEILGVEASLLGARATLEQVVASRRPEDHLMKWQREVLAESLADVLKEPVLPSEETLL